jgi:asparagine synthetase B (glutamine-hydrolysing)
MTGVVAIASHKRDARVSDAEINDLTSAYESLRGVGTRQVARAGDFARVAEISLDVDVSNFSAPTAGSSWVIATGTPHDSGSSGGTDLDALDGQFAWASYDAARAELSIATDPFGMQALYLAERNGKTYFSTSALALAKHLGSRPSRLGLGVYLRAGLQFGSVTNWEGIERLDPGTRVTFTARGPVRQTYWRPSVDDAVTRLSLAEAVDHCRNVATETFRAYYLSQWSRSWADLTGGYDSRLLTLLLREAGIDFIANTVGDERNPDVRIAAQVASVTGWDWSRFDLPGDWREVLPKLILFSVAWGDCHLDAVQLAEVLWGHLEKARVYRSLFSGGGGEQFRDRAWQQEFLRGGRSNDVNLDNFVDMKLLKPINTEVFAQDPTVEVREDLRTRLGARAEPYSSHLNTVQLDILHAYKSTGHHGAYLSAASGILNTELPFYLKPVFNAVFSTSYRHRGAHRLMRRMIEALDPRVAAIATTSGGPAQPRRMTNLHRFLPYYANIGRKAAAKLSQQLLPRPVLMPAVLPDPVRAAARGDLVNGLDEGRPLRAEAMRCGPLFKRQALNELLTRAGEPGLEDAALLCRILTVELALRAADSAVDA